jgi:hypothetical protein
VGPKSGPLGTWQKGLLEACGGLDGHCPPRETVVFRAPIHVAPRETVVFRAPIHVAPRETVVFRALIVVAPRRETAAFRGNSYEIVRKNQ